MFNHTEGFSDPIMGHSLAKDLKIQIFHKFYHLLGSKTFL